MPELNAHIGVGGSFILIGGQPGAYLDALRDAKNMLSASQPGKTPIAAEKAAFADFMIEAGARAPATVALISEGVIQRTPGLELTVASFLETLPQGTYFCKPNRGCNGVGAFRLTASSDGFAIDDEPSDAAAVAERLTSKAYLIQEWLAPRQHADIARFKRGVINTLRLVSFATESGAKPFAASLRMAISLNSIDSWTQGGVVAPIDLETGMLQPCGILKKGLKVVEAHPGCGLAFRGQPIPHFNSAVAMACSLHSKLDQVKSLGWDIALLEDGPCILETNRRWDILMSAQLNPDFPRRFLEFHLPHSPDLAVRVDMTGSFANRDHITRRLCRIMGMSMASGRIEQLTRERLRLLVGGARQPVQTAVVVLKRRARELGAKTMAIARTAVGPEPGFDITAAYRATVATEPAHPG